MDNQSNINTVGALSYIITKVDQTSVWLEDANEIELVIGFLPI